MNIALSVGCRPRPSRSRLPRRTSASAESRQAAIEIGDWSRWWSKLGG